MKRAEERKKIFVVMPAYNAEKTLPLVFKRITPEVWRKITKVILINDGSRDKTLAVANRMKDKYKKVIIIDKKVNEGYARGQKSGYKEALKRGADIAVLLHSDGQYAPEEMPRLLRPLEEGTADMVMGSRMKNRIGALRGGMPIYKWVANYCLSKLENLVYGLNFSEYHSGYMLYSKKALVTIPFERLSDTFHFDGEMLLVGAKKGLRVADLPIPTHYGNEKSHLKPIEYGVNVLKIMWEYKRGKYNF